MTKYRVNYYPNINLLNQAIIKVFFMAMAVLSLYSVLDNKETLADPTLVFENPELEEGTAGNVGAVYRFESVLDGVDALVEIENSVNTSLVDIDLTNTGDYNSFQPQVQITNQASGGSTGYMDFRISFVVAGTSTPTNITSWTATAVDVDGDDYRLRESVGLEVMDIYTLENPTLLSLDASGSDIIFFDASTIANQPGITVTATEHMISATYKNKTDFLYRTRIIADPNSDGPSSAGDRMFSLNFDPTLVENYITPVSFPVELIGFNGKVLGDKIQLDWSTASELNNDYFEIQRSADGLAFTTIGQIEGSGTSQETIHYRFNDNTPHEGLNYYRLKQVDFDGQFNLSETITLKATPASFQLHVFPNPVSDYLNVTARGDQTIGKLELLNMSGQRVHAPVTIKDAAWWEVNVTHLSSGTYFVRVETENAVNPLQKIVIE